MRDRYGGLDSEGEEWPVNYCLKKLLFKQQGDALGYLKTDRLEGGPFA